MEKDVFDLPPKQQANEFISFSTFHDIRTLEVLLKRFETEETANIQLISEENDGKFLVLAAYCDSLLNFLYPYLSLNVAYDKLHREIKLIPVNRDETAKSAKLALTLCVDVRNGSTIKQLPSPLPEVDRSLPNLNLGQISPRSDDRRPYMDATFSSLMMVADKKRTELGRPILKQPFQVKKVPQDLIERLPVDHLEIPRYSPITGGSGPRHLLPSCDSYWSGRDRSVPDFFKRLNELQ